MSGHSKWAQIKRKKGVADVRRGQLFTKLGREIAVAVREGGPDPDANFRLRMAIERARSENMPMDNIQRTIDRAAGRGGEAAMIEEVVYEGYGPHGVALVVNTATDNRNRSVADVRNALTRGGGSLGETGCVAWLFDVKGYIAIDVLEEDEGDVGPEELQERGEEIALQAMDVDGVADVQVSGETVDVYTEMVNLGRVRARLGEMDLRIATAEKTYVPKSTLMLNVRDTVQIMKLVERLEELDDVQSVFSNLEITEEALMALEE